MKIKEHKDRINDLARKYANNGYILLAVNPNDPEVQPADSYEYMQERAREKAFAFPYLFDKEQKVYPEYGATKKPHVYVLDNKLTVRYIGAIDDYADDAARVQIRYIEKAIQAIEKGEEPTPAVTKAIGCSIKFKK